MINAIINKHLPKAFDTQLKDAVTTFAATRKGATGEYDPVLGEYVGGADISYTGRGVISNYNKEELQATQIEITDVKLLCLQIESTIAPQVDDVITANNVARRVLNVSQDATSSLWVMQLRGLNVG